MTLFVLGTYAVAASGWVAALIFRVLATVAAEESRRLRTELERERSVTAAGLRQLSRELDTLEARAKCPP